MGQGISRGIFAPAISYNPYNKTYYMITTDVGAGSFIVKTQDPFGHWSEPIDLPSVGGIDPSLFFDEDGRAYIVNNDGSEGTPEYNGHRIIRVHEFDVKIDKTIGDGRGKVIVVNGNKPIFLKVVSKGTHYDFYYALEEDQWQLLCSNISAQHLSTAHAGGFTGTTIGMYATR